MLKTKEWYITRDRYSDGAPRRFVHVWAQRPTPETHKHVDGSVSSCFWERGNAIPIMEVAAYDFKRRFGIPLKELGFGEEGILQINVTFNWFHV